MARFGDARGKFDHDEDQIYVDRDGIPHYNGENKKLLIQYKRRVTLEYEGYTEDEKEKKEVLGIKLLRGLSGKAWAVCESLSAADLKKDGGHKLVIAALDGLDEEAITKKKECFDAFFKRRRERMEPMADYMTDKLRLWHEVRELDSKTRLSDDLLAYLVLEGTRLPEDKKRMIVQTSGNDYNLSQFVLSLKVYYQHIHLQDLGDGDADFAELDSASLKSSVFEEDSCTGSKETEAGTRVPPVGFIDTMGPTQQDIPPAASRIPNPPPTSQVPSSTPSASGERVTAPSHNGVKCPKCGSMMVPRQNRTNGNMFFGCEKFPECRGTRPYQDGSAMAEALRPPSP